MKGREPGWDGPTLQHPEILYHASPAENRVSILSLGLDAAFSDAAQTAGKDYVGGGGIFLSSQPSNSSVDVWAVNVKGLPLERDRTTDHDHLGAQWWVLYDAERIDPSRLTRVLTLQGTHKAA